MDAFLAGLTANLPGVLFTILATVVLQWQSNRKIEIGRNEAIAKSENVRTDTADKVAANRADQEKVNRETAAELAKQYRELMDRFVLVSNQASGSAALVKSLQEAAIASNERESRRDQQLGEMKARIETLTTENNSLKALVADFNALGSTTNAALNTVNDQIKVVNKQVSDVLNNQAVLAAGGTANADTHAAHAINVAEDAAAFAGPGTPLAAGSEPVPAAAPPPAEGEAALTAPGVITVSNPTELPKEGTP